LQHTLFRARQPKRRAVERQPAAVSMSSSPSWCIAGAWARTAPARAS